MKKILVVEDESSVKATIMEIFGLEGFDVIGAENGIVGLQYAREQQPDLIICDIMMPELDGYDMLVELRKDALIAATPFIFLSARTDKEEVRKGMELGADDYLTKPFSVSELLSAVLSAFKRRELIKEVLRKELESHVFLSYSRKDIEIMKRICDGLSNNNLKVWTDEQLEPGTPDWEQAVVSSVKNTGCLVVILSPDAEKSKWVGRELALAEILGVRIFPVLARGDERSSIPFRLISYQWIDCRHDYENALEKLASAVRKHLKMG